VIFFRGVTAGAIYRDGVPRRTQESPRKKNQVPSSITGCKFTSQGRTDLSLLFLPASIFVGPETAAELGELIISMRFFFK
jgi:hypothetical protein